MKYLFSLLLLLLISPLYAQYEPVADGELIAHDHYSLDYNEEYEQPNWVYYKMTAENLSGVAKRSNKFKVDAKVSTLSAQLSDYKSSGYDRGHLCPAADMSQSQEAMDQSFYMSNMSPQAPSFNRGIWKQCEERVRGFVETTLYVVTGPIFSDEMAEIGEGVAVPLSYYKVAYDPDKGVMYAYIIPNQKADKELSAYRCTVDDVEQAIGVDLFYQLPDEVENRLEN